MGVFNNFPYANFHELNADWIIEQVREVKNEWEEYKTDMDLWKLSVDDQLAEFQAWFDNLDVQDEVRTVIHELIQSGEFIEITGPQIVSATEAWLAAHITPTTPAVDDTLSISGAAADAKVTGDRISDLKEDLSQSITTFFELVDWRNGFLRTSSPAGSVGNDPSGLVSGYNGTYATQKGDGGTYSITMQPGWILSRIAKYSDRTLGSFVEFLDLTNNKVTLSEDNYYIAYIYKQTQEAISPSDVTSNTIVLADEEVYPKLSEPVHSYNLCNPVDITKHAGKYINTSGVIGSGSQYSYTDFIPVNQGDVVYVLHDGMPSASARFRFVTAYDTDQVVMPEAGESTTGRIYTIPAGVKYIIISIFLDDYNLGEYSININKMMPYDAYNVEQMPTGVGENKNRIDLLEYLPLSTTPEYIVNTLSYKPLPNLNKGYICLVSDDGMNELVTYTIPMVIDKDVPCTFAVSSDSQCFDTTGETNAVIDAVQNHGCAISQHGTRNWTEYSECGLYEYFKTEKEFFDNLSLPVKSAVIPSHYTTPLISAIAGGRFGVVRSGYKGYDAEGVYGNTVHDYYNYYTSGEGSNMYGLSSYNFSGRSLADNQIAIDYAYANNKILIVYWHENALDASKKAIIEASIDYAKTKGLEFITLDKIPHLNEWQATF